MANELHTTGLSFSQLYAILSARKFALVFILVATMVGTYALTQFLPKTYTTTAELFIDYRANDPLNGKQFSSVQEESYMQTQVDMIKSDEVANVVIDQTKMMIKDGVKKADGPDGDSRARMLMIEQMGKALEVVLRRSSRVVELRYSADSPTLARDALNATLKAYIDLVQRVTAAPAKSRQEQYSAQLETLRQELDKIQDSITGYQQLHGIIDADERLDTETRQLSDLTAQQGALQNQRLAANAKRRAIENLVKTGVPASEIAEVSLQRGLPELRLRLADAERQLAEVGSVYGKNHPRFKMVAAERDTLLQRVSRESQIALNAEVLDERRFDQQVQSIANEIQGKQKKLLEMKRHRDVLSSYQRQQETVRQIYTAAVQKYDELLIASTVNIPSLSVLKWAVAPYTHSKPKLRNNMIMSVPIGLLLGLAFIFLSELSGRRLRHIDDLERELNIDVLGRVGDHHAR